MSNFSHLSLTRPIIIPQERSSLISVRYLATLMILASYLQSRINKIPNHQRKSQQRSNFKNKKSKFWRDSAKKKKTSKQLSRRMIKRPKKLLEKILKKPRRL